MYIKAFMGTHDNNHLRKRKTEKAKLRIPGTSTNQRRREKQRPIREGGRIARTNQQSVLVGTWLCRSGELTAGWPKEVVHTDIHPPSGNHCEKSCVMSGVEAVDDVRGGCPLAPLLCTAIIGGRCSLWLPLVPPSPLQPKGKASCG